jgi:hypothetical protein
MTAIGDDCRLTPVRENASIWVRIRNEQVSGLNHQLEPQPSIDFTLFGFGEKEVFIDTESQGPRNEILLRMLVCAQVEAGLPLTLEANILGDRSRILVELATRGSDAPIQVGTLEDGNSSITFTPAHLSTSFCD